MRWAIDPTHRSGVSVTTRTTPPATSASRIIAAQTSSERIALSTRPSRIAGTASTGSPSRTPNVRRFAAVSPVAVVPRGAPASTSIRYCSAPAAAPPPGTTRPKALLASCEVLICHQSVRRTAIHWTAHMHAKLPASSASISGNHHQPISRSRGAEDSTSTRPGPRT